MSPAPSLLACSIVTGLRILVHRIMPLEKKRFGGFEHHKAGGNWHVLRIVSCYFVHSSALPHSMARHPRPRRRPSSCFVQIPIMPISDPVNLAGPRISENVGISMFSPSSFFVVLLLFFLSSSSRPTTTRLLHPQRRATASPSRLSHRRERSHPLPNHDERRVRLE